jgi:hypothetical protein
VEWSRLDRLKLSYFSTARSQRRLDAAVDRLGRRAHAEVDSSLDSFPTWSNAPRAWRRGR